MNKAAVRTHIFGMLAEQGPEYVEIAKKVEAETLEFIRKVVADDDEDIGAAKVLGLTLATLELEDMFD